MDRPIEFKKTIRIKVPGVPNFIMAEGDVEKLSIADFTEDELQSIGDAWTQKLIERAKEIREIPTLRAT